MSPLTSADLWLLLAVGWAVIVGLAVETALVKRRAARRQTAADLRNANAEEAFWTSLAALVEQARTDIGTRPLGQIASVARIRKQIADNECRRLRDDLDAWGSS